MKNIIVLLPLVLTAMCTSQNGGQVKSIDIETVKIEVIGKNVQLVDVRTPNEFNAGHIDDAININVLDSATFAKKMEKMDKEKPIYIYCQMGGRSKQAAQKLKDLGFKTIFDYTGGYSEWDRQR